MAEDEKIGDIFAPNKHNMSTVIKKIAELEKDVNKNWNLNQELAQEIMPNYVEQELSELKVVLRELGNKLVGWQKEKQTDYDKKCFATSLQHTIDKLSGGEKPADDTLRRVEALRESHGTHGKAGPKPPNKNCPISGKAVFDGECVMIVLKKRNHHQKNGKKSKNT